MKLAMFLLWDENHKINKKERARESHQDSVNKVEVDKKNNQPSINQSIITVYTPTYQQPRHASEFCLNAAEDPTKRTKELIM